MWSSGTGQSQGGRAPGPGHRCCLSFHSPGTPPGLGGGLRPQGAGCRLAPSLGAVGGVGWSGELWPKPTAPLPCWACPVPLPAGPGPLDTAVSPSTLCLVRFWARPPGRVQPLCPADPLLPWSPSSARAPRAGPWGSPQWGLCGWGLKALLSQGDVVIRGRVMRVMVKGWGRRGAWAGRGAQSVGLSQKE